MSIITVNDKEVAARLSEIIKEKRLKSARAFALSIDVDPSYLSKVLKCERSITETTVDSIEEKYNIRPDWLLWGKGEKYGQERPHTPQNALILKGQDPDTGLKYIALLEKTLAEKEADLKVLRSTVTKITSIDERVDKLETTVGAHEGKWSEYEPMLLGLREFVTEELAGLKSLSREKVAVALGKKVAEQKKKAEQSHIQKD